MVILYNSGQREYTHNRTVRRMETHSNRPDRRSDLDILSELIGLSPALCVLDVSGNRLSVAGLDALAAGVAACSSLRSLSLNNTQARVIPASMLQLLSRLDELTVHGNALLFPPDEVVATGTACVMEYLSSAQELNLSGSDVQGDDVKWIVEALPMMPHLAALDISKTKIGCEGLKALASISLQTR